MTSFLILVHALAAVAALLAGYLAIVLRKGSGLHAAAGTVFAFSMLGMSSTAAVIASFMKVNMINVTAALLTLYLVSTGWRAIRRRDDTPDRYDSVALLFVVGVSSIAIVSGFIASTSPRGSLHGMPAPLYFIFGSVALLHAISDVWTIRRGGARGSSRLARHLWRMNLALLIATLSFYPGQAPLFPAWLRETKILFLPHFLLLGTILFWVVRMWGLRRRRERLRIRPVVPPVGSPEAVGLRHQ